MFKLFNKYKKTCEIVSPINGHCISIEQVEDNMFAEKLLGDGVGLRLDDGFLYSPCDGTVVMVAATKHAIGIKSYNGVEILIHIGLDTVNLNGKGFNILVKEGQEVKAGLPMVNIDMEFMEKSKANLMTPMIITNAGEFHLTIKDNNQVKVGDTIITATRK